MNVQDDTLIKWGKIIAAFSAIVALLSTGIVAALGGWDFVFDAGVVHFGVVGVGFGLLVWAAIGVQARNGAAWAFAGAAFFAALSTAGFAVVIAWGQGSIPEFDIETFNGLRPTDLPLPVAIAMQPVTWAWLPVFFLPVTLGLLLFPDGRPPSPRWKWAGWYSATTISLATAATAWLARPSSTLTFEAPPESEPAELAVQIAGGLDFLTMLGTVFALSALVVRYRRSSGTTRRQIRWIGWGSTFLAAAIAWTFATEGTSLGETGAPVALIGEIVLIVSFAVAITKYRLYDIDVVISRTVAYLALAVVIAGLYVAAVFTLAAVFGDPDQGVADLGAGFWFGATTLVAIVFEPLRVRLQRLANRMVYGQRTAPHQVLSQLTSQLSDTSRGEGLVGLAELLREGTGADGATVWLRVGDRLRAEATAPADTPTSSSEVATEEDLPVSEVELSAPVHHGGELLGALGITKPRAHPVTPADETLLIDVAAGAGLLLRNLRLNAELTSRAKQLRASRRRLIAAHDAARHRLERDLHDGAQQQVVALKVRLGIAQTIAEREGAHELASRVADLADGTQQAVDAMRAVARGIYPPLLDTEGLGPALGTAHRSVDLPLEIDLGTLRRYSKAIEETVYFCVLTALDRAKMAGATSARVAVAGDDASLEVTVTYDSIAGPGELPELTDRVDAYGGTVAIQTAARETTLTLTLPVRAGVMEPA